MKEKNTVATNGNGNVERPVTTKQLAEHLQLTTRTLANYRASGRISLVKPRFRGVIREARNRVGRGSRYSEPFRVVQKARRYFLRGFSGRGASAGGSEGSFFTAQRCSP